MEKTAEILFEYLKNILYHPDKARLNPEELPPEFQKLGSGMQFLEQCVREERTFMHALAKGDLSKEPPTVDNVLAGPSKELQGSLRHLTWQTKQVAKGDYSQRVDFMGEFSESFNEMTKQLSERTERLIREQKRVEEINLDLKQNLDLMLTLINDTNNMIFVFSTESGERIFNNRAAEWFIKARPEDAALLQSSLQEKKIETEAASVNWEVPICREDNAGTSFYEVESFLIRWHNEPAVVHMAMDDTERKKRENLIENLAYLDPLTGLHNRRYAMDLMKKWLKEKRPFLLSFIDVDYLKYCNDTYGHECGDEYLVDLTSLLRTMDGELCRVGGDEFFLLSEGEDISERNGQLSYLRELLMSQNKSRYPRSFSFATSAIPASPVISLQEYINITDTLMYQYKLQYKQPLSDVLYEDDRV